MAWRPATSYAYDGADRLTGLTTPTGAAIALAYDTAGRTSTITRPNAVNTTAAYDTAGRLSQLAHALGAVDLARKTYQYNTLGNITQIAGLTRTRNYTYDALQRLTQVTDGIANVVENYTLDGEGNRTLSHLSALHTTNVANRLTETGQHTYSYDANGNLTAKTEKASGDITTYTWDAQDQMARIDYPDATFSTYKYDPFGRRMEKDLDDGAGGRTVKRYIYDGPDIALEYDGTNTQQARYTHGARTDQPLVAERGGQSYYYHNDHQGSIRLVTDGAGTAVNTYDYGAYGNAETTVETLDQPYRYTGREYDPESGLYYYRARYYDADTGRFISEDPIRFAAGDLNLYRYVLNDPVNFTDPSGKVVLAPGADEMIQDLIDRARAPRNPNSCSAPPGFVPDFSRPLFSNPSDDKERKKLSDAGKAPDKGGKTKAGRSLQKKTDRPNSSYDRPKDQSDQGFNDAGQKELDSILNDTGSTVETNSRGQVTVTSQNGKAAKFNGDGSFQGFREP